MKKKCNIYANFAIISYSIKFLVEAVMYFYTIFNKSDTYYDDWYLLIPQIISTFFLFFFYTLFFSKKFYGLFVKISSAVIAGINLLFIILLTFDRTKGHVFYFALVAAINFLNALHIKCNIVPIRKPGSIEYGPLFFETLSLTVMVLSIYSVFCGFPLSYNSILSMWNYYDVLTSLKLNVLTSLTIAIEYLLCRRNDCEYIRDNMIEESYLVFNMTDKAK